MHLEHPAISRVSLTGYENVVAQPEHCGMDIFGDEIICGDDYVEYDGELILLDNLQRYLSEHMDFKFKTAE
jgi:hypothetical protein